MDVDRVTVEIAPAESGCELTLTHEMDPAYAEYASQVEQAWQGILKGLAAALG